MFDYALTFEEEVTRYWATGLTWGTALFYINRYSALIGTIPILVELQLTTIDPNKMVVRTRRLHRRLISFLHCRSRCEISFQSKYCWMVNSSVTRCKAFRHYHALFVLLSQILVAGALRFVYVRRKCLKSPLSHAHNAHLCPVRAQ